MTSSSSVPIVVLDVLMITLTPWTFSVGNKKDKVKQNKTRHEDSMVDIICYNHPNKENKLNY